MAESLVTQVARPDDQPEHPRPNRKPKLKLEVDANGNAAGSSDQADEKADVDNRVSGLGKIFSRQFTPTVPKTTDFSQDKERMAAQSPRNKVQSPKGLATHNEDEEQGDSTGAPPAGGVGNDPTGKKSLWQSIWSCFLSDQDRAAYNMQSKPDNADASGNESPAGPNVNSPRGQKGASIDFPTGGATVATPPPDAVQDEEEFVPDPDALLAPNTSGKKHCLVLDLDETLVHSSFKPVPQCDFVLSIEMDGITHKVYVLKRPGVDEFLVKMAEIYELVIFTASLDKYANPLLDLLDTHKTISGRLYREHCTRQGQTYVKDLGRLGRRLNHTYIIDNSPYSYAMHMNHAVPILTWFDDPHDTELLDMMPFLENLTKIKDVSAVLDANKPWRVTNKKLTKMISDEANE